MSDAITSSEQKLNILYCILFGRSINIIWLLIGCKKSLIFLKLLSLWMNLGVYEKEQMRSTLFPRNKIRWFERVTRGHGLSYCTTVHFYTIFRVWFEFTAEFKLFKNEPLILLTETHIIQLHKRHSFSSILTMCRTLGDWS